MKSTDPGVNVIIFLLIFWKISIFIVWTAEKCLYMNIIPSIFWERNKASKRIRNIPVNRKLIFPWEFLPYTHQPWTLSSLWRKLYNFCYEFSRTFETIFCNIIIFHNVLYFLLWKKIPYNFLLFFLPYYYYGTTAPSLAHTYIQYKCIICE